MNDTADLRAITAQGIKRVLRGMARASDDATLKDCVMIARADGHLSDEETEFYIAAWGLTNA